jgi:NitT/TauT family transport system ATP-binding protein
MTDPTGNILELSRVCKAFAKPSGEPLAVLSGVDVALREGEILGLLGRSGSGKSTLLRIAAGLLKPTTGVVRYRGEPLDGPAEGIAVVFQTFALFPWLTVLENVELGLEALGLPREETRARTLGAIDLIGLDGFQSAYPRELSGGMRQRVGFARALVTHPVALLMDEPFSALDVLTAETLRTDLLDLWVEHRLPTKGVLLVTHNIEEAVLLCDRILVLQPNPGRIAAEIPVPLKHPRQRVDEAFQKIVDEIYSVLTAHTAQSPRGQAPARPGLYQPLPNVSVNRIAGLAEAVASPPYGGSADLADVAQSLNLEIDGLFPVTDALHILGLADLDEGRIRLTAAGKMFAEGGTEERKHLFAEHLLQFVPLVAHVRHVLGEREGHRAPRVRFESELEDHLTRVDAERTLRAVIGWGRYAEVFDYDARTRMFSRRSEGP